MTLERAFIQDHDYSIEILEFNQLDWNFNNFSNALKNHEESFNKILMDLQMNGVLNFEDL